MDSTESTGLEHNDCQPLEQRHGNIDAGGDDGHHAHELDQDVQGGAGRILEGVAHCLLYTSDAADE